jgi:hypothetical protein
VRIADKNAMGPPSVERNLAQSNRVVDSPSGNDPMANKLIIAAPAAPKGTMRNDSGMLFFKPRIVMEEKRPQEEAKPPPELGILTKDPNIAKAVELVLQMKMTDRKEVLAFLKDYARKNKLKFNSFAVVRALVAEGKLGNVDGIIYKTMPAFKLPADNEMEVPERYNR